jgi:hypothetical protein
MLLLFSDGSMPAPGLAAAIKATGRFFPNYSSWAVITRRLRCALSAFYQRHGEFLQPPVVSSNRGLGGVFDLLATWPLSQAILALAFSRGNIDPERSVREGLSLYFKYGKESRRLGRQGLWFSAAGLAFLFLCLALPNWFFFRSAGAPVWIGVALAAAISCLLHQAFVIPFLLAGLSVTLLSETRDKIPDPELCEKLEFLDPDMALPDK